MPPESPLPESLNKLALDIYKGLVFTSRDIWDATPVEQVFMGLLFLNDAARTYIQANPPGLLFGYYAEAAPRAVNGNPIFFEFGILTPENAKKVYAVVDRLRVATEQVLNEES